MSLSTGRSFNPRCQHHELLHAQRRRKPPLCRPCRRPCQGCHDHRCHQGCLGSWACQGCHDHRYRGSRRGCPELFRHDHPCRACQGCQCLRCRSRCLVWHLCHIRQPARPGWTALRRRLASQPHRPCLPGSVKSMRSAMMLPSLFFNYSLATIELDWLAPKACNIVQCRLPPSITVCDQNPRLCLFSSPAFALSCGMNWRSTELLRH